MLFVISYQLSMTESWFSVARALTLTLTLTLLSGCVGSPRSQLLPVAPVDWGILALGLESIHGQIIIRGG